MSVRLVALGGLGEFGANSMWLEDEGGAGLLIDAGASFPDAPVFGVGFELPDYAGFSRRPPVAVVVTHAHDDHIKGLSQVCAAWPDVPVLASAATAASARAALGQEDAARVREFREDGAATLGPFTVDVAPLSHSIPGTVAVRVRRAASTVVVATDWRLAPSALGETTATSILARWGDEGVDLALLDATNALVAELPPPEEDVAATLAELVRSAPRAVVAVSFASHAGRFRQLALAGGAVGRPVVPVGRGLVEMLQLHGQLGLLRLPPGVVHPGRGLAHLDRDRVLIVATGSQGEPGSAFARLGAGLLAGFSLQPGDTVLHAARVIPGNERHLAALFDECVRRGAKVVTASEAPIHASGHAPRSEIAAMIALLRPREVLPVHGRRRNLEAVAEIATTVGARALVAENGDEVVLGATGVRRSGELRPTGRIVFDDVDESIIDTAILRQRRTMARDGLVVATAAAVGAGGRFVVTLGAHGVTLPEGFRRRAAEAMAGELRALSPLLVRDPDAVRSTMTRWLRRELRRSMGRPPGVLAYVVET